MGKKIDRFALTSVLAIFLYFYFDSAFGSRMMAVLLSLVCCALIIKAIHRIKRHFFSSSWYQKRELRRRAGSALMHLACMDKEEAHSLIARLIETCYQDNSPIELEQLHPTLQLPSSRVFDLWRMHQHTNELIICTTGICNSETLILAKSLKQPRIAVIDAAALAQLIAEHPHGFYTETCGAKKCRLRLKQLATLLFNRRNAPRCMLFSFSMLVMYVFSGNAYYLAFSLMLLFIALSSFHHPVRPAKLF